MNTSIPPRNLAYSIMHELARMVVEKDPFFVKGIVTEAVIAQHFDASRTAAREAVKALISKGMLSSRQKMGITPQPLKHWNLLDADVLHWLSSTDAKHEIVENFFSFRLSIEPEAARLTASERTKDQLVELEMALLGLKKAELQYVNPAEYLSMFYSALLRSNNNCFFQYLGTSLESLYDMSFHLMGYQPILKTQFSSAAFQDIFSCILDKDGESASVFVKKNILADLDSLRSRLPQEQAVPATTF